MKRMILMTVLLLAGMMLIIPLVIVDTERTAVKEDTGNIRVYLHEEDRIEEMTMDDYLIGTLAAEMPAAFEEEALKAQAVAVRTYTAQQMVRYGGKGYKGADISTDYRVHQAYIGEAKQREKWGDKYDAYREKLRHAVRATAGEVATYDGKLIRALYHSSCGGRTASSQEVWDKALAYLVSVPCKWDADAPRYREEQRVTFADIAANLGEDATVMTASADGSDIVQVVNRTESGRADLVRIGGQNYAGYDVRAKLALRSANFTAKADKDGIIFTTVGYGHGVGLCQYGANGMAKAGHSYRDILTHYYQGITIQPIEQIKRI
ncbi:MAG: stage II sporulation protein D [Selenomonadales bacterium]|nr:stage II sporulation protein D [Selenomonadales bacterium]